jgi:hypothetical protein
VEVVDEAHHIVAGTVRIGGGAAMKKLASVWVQCDMEFGIGVWFACGGVGARHQVKTDRILFNGEKAEASVRELILSTLGEDGQG